MSRAASYSTVSGQPRTFAIAGSLLLVSVSYVLLLSAPILTRHLRSVVTGIGGARAAEWLPLACGAGLVLGGASALVFVLTQIAREAERRPYVCLAPVLAAFAACILIGLRADLPLKGVTSEQLAVFALALSVVGGALVQNGRIPAQMLGLAFTFLPPLSLFVVLWALSGRTDPAQAIWAMSAAGRAFLGMLTLSSFAIAAVATLGRRSEQALSARLPRDPEGYVLYELEEDLAADEARLRQRGLPGWAIVLAALTAVVLSFMALKLFLERRAAPETLSSPARPSEPVHVADAPTAEPLVREPSPAAVEPVAPAPSEPAASVSAAAVTSLAQQVEDKKPAAVQAPPEQALHEPSAARASAPAVARERASARAPEGALRPTRAAAQRTRGSHLERRAARSTSPKRAALAAPVPVPRAEPVIAAQAPEAKPERKALPKAQSVADVALEAAALAAKNAKGKSEAKPVQNDGLDELMDSALKSEKGAKKQKANEDPIYGL